MHARNLLLPMAATVASLLVSALWLRAIPRAGEPLRAASGACVAEARPPRLEASGAPAQSRSPLAMQQDGASAPTRAAALVELERAAELALAEERTDEERILALQALWSARSPRAAALFATAIRTLPDASRSASASVPRFALACLLRASAWDEGARLALESVAWDSRVETSPELRALAAAGLGAVAREYEALRIVDHLRTEPDARVRAAAAGALCRNPEAGTAAEIAVAWAAAVSTLTAEAEE